MLHIIRGFNNQEMEESKDKQKKSGADAINISWLLV